MEGGNIEFWLFLGRFHPVVVHLPIGFLLIGIILDILVIFKKKEILLPSLPIIYFLSAAGALVSVLLGFFLSIDGGYQERTLSLHMWSGILTFLLAGLLWIMQLGTFRRRRITYPFFLGLTIAVLTFTGHMGGTLTHGSGYLSEYGPGWFSGGRDSHSAGEDEIPLPEVLDSVLVFAHLVSPVLETHCFSCHNPEKSKGDLDLSTYAALSRGGSGAQTLVPNDPGASELIRRITLPADHDEFMPPGDKPPVPEDAVLLLEGWVASGASRFLVLAELDLDEQVTLWINEYLELEQETGASGLNVPEVLDSILMVLLEHGIIARRLEEGSNLLDVSMASISPDSILEKMGILTPFSENVIWLDLSNQGLTDQEAVFLEAYVNLERLKMNNNLITGGICDVLSGLEHLHYLGLYGNPLEDTCALYLANAGG